MDLNAVGVLLTLCNSFCFSLCCFSGRSSCVQCCSILKCGSPIERCHRFYSVKYKQCFLHLHPDTIVNCRFTLILFHTRKTHVVSSFVFSQDHQFVLRNKNRFCSICALRACLKTFVVFVCTVLPKSLLFTSTFCTMQ